MKIAAFYAACVLMLCVMIFGGIEGFSFKLRVDAGYFITGDSELPSEQITLPLEQQNMFDFKQTTSDKTSMGKQKLIN